jgi:predicted NBD/HSP70 family sugar kinase
VRAVLIELIRRGGAARISDIDLPATTLRRVRKALGPEALGTRPHAERRSNRPGHPEHELYLNLPSPETGAGDRASKGPWGHLIGLSFIPEVSRVYWARTDLAGRLLHRGDRRWEPGRLDMFLQAVGSCLQEAAPGEDREYHVGISVYGHVDGRTGQVLRSPLFRFLEARGGPVGGLEDRIRRVVPAPAGPTTVTLDNEVRALALQRRLLPGTAGGEQRAACFAVVKLHYGVGAALALDGAPESLYYGHTGLAGELGHCQVERDPQAQPCRCGRGKGHVESLFQPGELRLMYEQALQGAVDLLPPVPDESDADEVMAGDDAVIGLVENRKPGSGGLAETAARQALERAATGLGRGLCYLDLLVEPAEIVLLSRPALNDSLYFRSVVDEVRGRESYDGKTEGKLVWREYNHADSAIAAAALAARGFLDHVAPSARP